jgi:tight adherence protein B
MLTPLVISIVVFIGVSALVIGIAFIMRGDKDQEVEDRLSVLTGGKKKKGGAADAAQYAELLASMRNDGTSAIERLIARYLNLRLLFEQADVALPIPQFLIICAVLAAVGVVLPTAAGMNVLFAPLVGGFLAFLPIIWLLMRRKRRLKKFAAQLPEALELIARALRAGHSLAAGMNLVAHEMSPPIALEFSRTFEEQNLGIPLEEALESLTQRVPNLDLKFFATAIVLQRQTGGDLAEILDKIGYLVRERFKIWGQVQALTGEGRLSGIVLLALPPALFAVVYRMNPEYLMLLFTDEMGKKMLVGGVLMQLFGALVIRKIVNIRV